MDSQQRAGSVAEWLHDLCAGRELTRKSLSVIRLLAASPRLTSFGSVREIAEKADVSIGTVTRTAQALGFAGWPALQKEARALYLATLSTLDTDKTTNGDEETPAYASLARDRDNLHSFMNTVDLPQIRRVARLISSSRRTFIIAMGSAIGVGQVLAHNAWLYGYDIRLISEESQIVNTVAHTEPEDLVVVISFWQIYENSYQTIQACEELGTPVVLLTETVTRQFEQQCEECIRIPTEGIDFTTSLSTATSAVHAILSELVAVDPERSGRKIERADRQWSRFNLLHHF